MADLVIQANAWMTEVLASHPPGRRDAYPTMPGVWL